MSDVESLAEKRAIKNADSKLWTPLDMARALVRDIENGTIKPDQIIVHYFEPDGEGHSHGSYGAGVGFPEHFSILAVAHDWLINRWKK